MTANHVEALPGLALVMSEGVTIDVPHDLVPAILAAELVVRRECVKWSRMFGSGGRVILIDPELVARILDGWPEIAG
jgi:hypothetical protein